MRRSARMQGRRRMRVVRLPVEGTREHTPVRPRRRRSEGAIRSSIAPLRRGRPRTTRASHAKTCTPVGTAMARRRGDPQPAAPQAHEGTCGAPTAQAKTPTPPATTHRGPADSGVRNQGGITSTPAGGRKEDVEIGLAKNQKRCCTERITRAPAVKRPVENARSASRKVPAIPPGTRQASSRRRTAAPSEERHAAERHRARVRRADDQSIAPALAEISMKPSRAARVAPGPRVFGAGQRRNLNQPPSGATTRTASREGHPPTHRPIA